MTALAEARMADRLRVVLRELARRDIEESVDWHRDHVDVDTALRFVATIEDALDHVARHSRTGSPRYATELDVPGLRSWLLTGPPHLVFYVTHDDHVDVWRLLHAHRDIPTSLAGTDAGRDDEEAG